MGREMLDKPQAFNNPELRRLMALCKLEHTFVQGQGVWLTDADGRRYLDAYAQYGAVALGHAAPEVAAAVRAALDARVPAMVQPYLAAQAEALGVRELRRGGGRGGAEAGSRAHRAIAGAGGDRRVPRQDAGRAGADRAGA